MNVNWMSLMLVLLDFAKDAGTGISGYLIGTGHGTAGGIVGAAVVAVGKIAVVFGQNQAKPAATPTAPVIQTAPTVAAPVEPQPMQVHT